MNETKITVASVRVMLSHNYSNFEVSAQLDNPNGIEIADIDKARSQCQQLAMDAVAEYKRLPNTNPKIELARVENKLADIKALINEKPEEKKPDQEEIKAVEKLPMYADVKGQKTKKAGTSKIPNDIIGLGADD
jgi:hypothetical protein